MNKSKKKEKNKRLSPSGMVGVALGSGLIALGAYQAFLHGNPGAYFVIFLGAALNAVIFLCYRG